MTAIQCLVGIFLIVQTGTVVLASPCSVANREADIQTCLDNITETLFDSNRFWFGTQYATICPNGQMGGIRCINFNPSAQSISTRLFTKTEHNPQLDRFLQLTTESIARNYTGCGATYTASSSDVLRKDIDPMSNNVEEPWFLRNRPAMQWNYTEGEYFTLIIYDVGYPVAHAVYANIEGNDVINSEVIKSYHGPLIATDIHNPYAFLLYKHAVMINVTDDLKNTITGGGNVLATFIDGLNLGGPVAVNWVTATGDPYAAQQSYDADWTYTCPVFSTKALLEKPRPFLPNDTSLSVWLDIHFSTSDFSFAACCKTFDYKTKQFNLNPINNPTWKTADVRSDAIASYNIKKMGYVSQINNFTGEMHTLIILDPDVPFAEAGTEERPLLHGITANIVDGSFLTGDVVRAYSGPSPPDNKPHWYYFLLYKQNGTVNGTHMVSYTGDPNTCRVPNRCLFNINQLVSDFGLELVGASWLKAERDEYVINRNPSLAAEYCADMSGYANPCPTAGAQSLHFINYGVTLLFVTSVLSILF